MHTNYCTRAGLQVSSELAQLIEQELPPQLRLDAARLAYRTYQDGLNAIVGLPALDIGLLSAEVYEGVDLDRRAGSPS